MNRAQKKTPRTCRGVRYAALRMALAIPSAAAVISGEADQWNCSSSVEPVSAVTEDEPPWITVVEMADVRFLRVCHDSAILGGVSGKFLLLAPSRSQSCRCEHSPAPKTKLVQRSFEVPGSFSISPIRQWVVCKLNYRWVSLRDS